MSVVGAALGAALALAAASSARSMPCAEVLSHAPTGSRLISAEAAPQGPTVRGSKSAPLDATPFCRITGVAGATVGFEVWLPQAWNGRLLAVGNGGFGGAVPVADMAEALRSGFAVVGEDTGHVGDDRSWMGDPERLREWGRTSVHLAIGPAKAVVEAFYGRPSQYAYFQGCSTGGAQAMAEAEFYPEDFDGIIAGAPGMSYLHLMLSFLWGLRTVNLHSDAVLTPEKLSLLHRSVLAACASPEALQQGMLDDPASCRFDPRRLLCPGADQDGCLTAHQLATALDLYAGPRNLRTGEQIYPGFVLGSEFDDTASNPLFGGWTAIQGPLAEAFAIPLLRNMGFDDPHWDWRQFDWDKDVDALDRRLGGQITATDPDLSGFIKRGGRLIMFQGWVDPLNAQTYPILYRYAVIDAAAHAENRTRSVAEGAVDRNFRLFMVPGLAHCTGGPGPDNLDALSALQVWVERGVAPRTIIARRLDQAGLRIERPVCAYPAVARWTGVGRGDRADEFVCRSPKAP